MIKDNCQMCGCAMLENVGGCGCSCHRLTERLVEFNNGDRERTRREMKEEDTRYEKSKEDYISKILGNAFNIPGVGVGIPMRKDEFMKLLGRETRRGNEVKVGTAIGNADPYTMSIQDLINHEVFMGIQTGVLPQGFRLSQMAHDELVKVLGINDKDKRISICIAYLAGYNRGYDFGKIDP